MTEEKPKFLETDPVNYQTVEERLNSGREVLWSRIETERTEARKNLAEVITYVDERYQSSNSTLSQSPEQLMVFKKHNEQVLKRAIEQGIKRGLDQDELLQLELAAILHDLTKGDQAPEWAADIDNFMLVYHGEAAAQELSENEELKQLVIAKLGEEGWEEKLVKVQRAILSHMGPHPGFMREMLEVVNKQLRAKGLVEIEHPYPTEGDVVAEVLLAADMYALASSKGIEKIMILRASTPFFRKQDQELSSQYKAVGIELDPGEAALISAFDSAYAARDMIRNSEDKLWIQGAIDKALEGTYRYQVKDGEGKIVTTKMFSIGSAQQKRKDFEAANRSRDLLEQVRGAGQ